MIRCAQLQSMHTMRCGAEAVAVCGAVWCGAAVKTRAVVCVSWVRTMTEQNQQDFIFPHCERVVMGSGKTRPSAGA